MDAAMVTTRLILPLFAVVTLLLAGCGELAQHRQRGIDGQALPTPAPTLRIPDPPAPVVAQAAGTLDGPSILPAKAEVPASAVRRALP